jgi:hypothetical protein
MWIDLALMGKELPDYYVTSAERANVRSHRPNDRCGEEILFVLLIGERRGRAGCHVGQLTPGVF